MAGSTPDGRIPADDRRRAMQVGRRAATVLAGAVLVVSVGVAAFLVARPTGPGEDRPAPAGTDSARTYVVDGRAYPCAAPNSVYLTATARGTTDARFVADGVEVAGEIGPGDEGPEVDALLDGPVMAIRCDDGGTHRVDVVTDTPDGCVLTVSPYGEYGDAKNGVKASGTATSPPGVCSLTVHD